jgi:AcrR family transcriptional regulator
MIVKMGGWQGRRVRRGVRGGRGDVEAEARILQAALRLLAEQGYTRMSLDGVAEEAGVSKPTIYRRWSSKADLATAALRTIQTGSRRWRRVRRRGI